MTIRMATMALLMSASALSAQTTPGEQFLANWDLDGNGTATVEEVREMRSSVFVTFDSNEDGTLDAEEYVMFDEARKNDVDNQQGQQRAQMQKMADALSLTTSDIDKDGSVSKDEFLTGADRWFAQLDRNGDGGITSADFGK